MKSSISDNREHRGSGAARPRLEDLVPIAVVIAAGCEKCAERLVRRALVRGNGRAPIRRTLRIVADLRSRGCFGQAVGPDVIARMENPLRTAERALEGAETGDGECCRPSPGGTVR